MSKDWASIFPIQDIMEDCMVSGNGITFGYKLELLEVYTISTIKKKNIYDEFRSLLKVLPIGTKVFKQDFFYASQYEKEHGNNDSVSIYQNKVHFDEKRIMSNKCFIYFTVPLSSVRTKSSADYVFKKPLKNVERDIEKARNLIASVEPRLLSWNSVRAQRLKNVDLRENLWRYFNLSYDQEGQPESMTLNPVQVEKEYVMVGSDFVKVMSLVEEGELSYYKVPKVDRTDIEGTDVDIDRDIALRSTMLFPVGVGLPFNHVLNTYVEITDPARIEGELKRRQVMLNGIRMFSQQAIAQQTMTIRYLETVASDSVVPVKVGFNIIIHDKNIDKLNIKEQLVKKAMENVNESRCLTENFNTLNAYRYSCPGNNGLFRHMMYSENEYAACYFNMEQHYRTDPEGFIVLDRMGAPKLLNLRNKKIINRFHGIMFAPTGGGKSYWLHWYMDNALCNGEDFVLINTKDDYKKFGEFYKELGNAVSYIDTSEEKIGIDIFFFKESETGIYEYDDQHLEMIVDILLLVWKNNSKIEEVEVSILNDVIKQFYSLSNQNRERPTFDKFLNFIEEFKMDFTKNDKYKNVKGVLMFDFNEFGLILEEFRHIFNEDHQIDISKSSLTIFDLSGVLPEKMNQKVFNIYLNFTFYIGTRKVNMNQKTQRFTNLVVDECIDSMEGRGGEIIGRAYRTYRSKNASVFITTQDVKFLKNLDPLVWDSIKVNLALTVLLDHSDNQESLPELKSTISMTPFGIDLLQSINKKEGADYRSFYLKYGAVEKVYRLSVSPFSNVLFNTDPEIVNALSNLRREGMSISEAINEYLSLKQKK